ncbi:DUF3890 domain-containing protein [Candidatus Borreliella tachyglossi]|uniref:DUF3890 domain-containing protein n=1 Tax=Candidatus Borreliella tachyglossi TaxID=1964448 RepID=UPI004042EA2B
MINSANTYISNSNSNMDNEDNLAEIKIIYTKVLALLSIKQEEVTFENFLLHSELLEATLINRGVDISLLSYANIFLLTYYFIGCELKKRGILTEFEFDRIKKQKFNELEIDYHPPPSPTDVNKEHKKNFCDLFDKLVDQSKKQTKTPSCIGVVR